MDKRLPKKTRRRLIIGALVVIVLSLLGTAYALAFNNGRFVHTMDLSAYTFQAKDLSMLIPGALLFCYVIYFLIVIWSHVIKLMFTKEPSKDGRQYSRTVSPRFGWLGFCGFFGFAGFWTYANTGQIYPFFFFIFFGFFGVLFEGKLSHTLEDELFQENRRRAELKAYRIGFVLIYVVILLVGLGLFQRNIEWCAVFMLAAISLIYGLIIFLSNYLLYRYERME
ncbi:MAG: DUF3796 domain-containing protein [Peptococcaceae bacterium]|nr:DUF3796 domain-containing protein [Peptococcaceae bacterium]